MAEVALPRQMFPNPEAHRPVAGAVRSNTKELGVERRGPRRQASPWLSLPGQLSRRTLLPWRPETVKIAS